MNSVSTITLPTNNNYNNNKQTTNYKNNENLLLSASISLVKTHLYQCWLQVYGPLFWIVSAMICVYSNNNNNTPSTTSTPRPPVLRYYSYYSQNHHHEVNSLKLRQGQQSKCCNNEDDNYNDEGEKDDNNIIGNEGPPSTLQVGHDKQADDLKLKVLTAPQPKKSLKRSVKLHMRSFKGSWNQLIRRSTTRFQRNKNHLNTYDNEINTYYHYNNNNNNNSNSSSNIKNESIVIHPLDFGLQSTCSSISTSTTPTKERIERRRESFVTTVTKTKNNPIFNSFRRKTAPEIDDFTIISDNNNNNDKNKKNKKKTSI